MIDLPVGDLNLIVRRLPRDVRDMLVAGPFFVGGGYIRETIAGNDVNDIDIFGPTEGQLIDIAASFATSRGVRTHHTDNAVTVLSPPRMPVQFITRWTFSDAESLIASFDFTVCQAVVWCDRTSKNWRGLAADSFYVDLAARRLSYTAPVRDEEAAGSMMRVCKFLKRGYNIEAQSLGAVIARVASKIDGFERKSEEERGVIITSLLREVDPLLVVDGLEPITEHTMGDRMGDIDASF